MPALILILTLVLALSVPTQEHEQLGRRPANGEICIVCGKLIQEGEIIELRMAGRTFHVAPDMLADFERDSLAYFKKLQARGALFDETGIGAPDRSWLWFGFVALAGVLFGAVIGCTVVSRRRKNLPDLAPHPCPGCGHGNHPRAAVCLQCGRALEPATPSEAQAVANKKQGG